uniref:Uncharacterized protein n=1 Tax=Glossina austeni TaxID=7395 RepID=A0A1A9VAN0_GLOAU
MDSYYHGHYHLAIWLYCITLSFIFHSSYVVYFPENDVIAALPDVLLLLLEEELEEEEVEEVLICGGKWLFIFKKESSKSLPQYLIVRLEIFGTYAIFSSNYVEKIYLHSINDVVPDGKFDIIVLLNGNEGLLLLSLNKPAQESALGLLLGATVEAGGAKFITGCGLTSVPVALAVAVVVVGVVVTDAVVHVIVLFTVCCIINFLFANPGGYCLLLTADSLPELLPIDDRFTCCVVDC